MPMRECFRPGTHACKAVPVTEAMAAHSGLAILALVTYRTLREECGSLAPPQVDDLPSWPWPTMDASGLSSRASVAES
jgi:hypothetical protein